MNEIELYKLWNKLQSAPEDFGTFDEFKKRMSTKEQRHNFYLKYYDKLYTLGIYLGEESDFENRLGLSVNDQSEWSKFPCVTSRPDFKNTSSAKYTYTSSNTEYGVVTLLINGTFTSTGSKYTKGKWSCTQTGKIFLEGESITSSTTGATTPPGFTPSPATSDDIKNGKLVKFGMTGNIVTEIQKLLIQKGYTSISKTGEPDGIFGIRTYNSVKKFQELNGLKPDGVVGKLTYAKLTDANAVKYDGSAMSITSPTRSTSSSSNQPQIKECTDFPFSFGCKNPKIADIRKKLIGDNKDVYDQDLYNAVKEDLKVGDKRITQDVYNKIMGI